MKKIGLLKNEKMGEYEKKQGYASYRTLVNYCIGDIVLCNNIAEIDPTIWDNLSDILERYYNADGEEITEDEYINDETGEAYSEQEEIYQYFLCNLGQWEREQAEKMGLILSHSDLLDCDVLCVDHFGTSWDYVLTNVKLFDTYEELTAYENQNE